MTFRQLPSLLLVLPALLTPACGRGPGTFVAGQAGPEQAADAVVYARVITMDPALPRAKGLAIRGGLIVEVSTPEKLQRLVGPDTKIFNWRSRTVVPGLIDAHVDLQALGETMVGLDLKDAGGMDDIASRVRAVLAERGLGEYRWIVGHGWEEHRFRDGSVPDRRLLDAIAPNRPVLLYRADRRSVLVNGEALRLAGVDDQTPDPPGGRLEHRPDGSLSGLVQGRAVGLVTRLIPPHPTDVLQALLKAALDRLAEAGYTSVQDLGGSSATWQALLALGEAGQLPIRVYTSVDSQDPELESLLSAGPQIGLFQHLLTLRTVRLDLDGELGGQTASLLAPYTDAPDRQGLEIASRTALHELATRLYKDGFQLALHASGDGAVRASLDALELLLPGWAHWDAVRPRLEGADVVAPDDASRFGLTHLIASVQPVRLARQMHWLGDRLGEERLEFVHPWRGLQQGGATVVLGSGAPELDFDPRAVFTAAVSRADESGWPAGGWKPMQRLPAADALAALTLNAAHAAFEEQLKGSLQPGKLADMTVLSTDILYTDIEDLYRLRVLGTLVGGKLRYRTRHLR